MSAAPAEPCTGLEALLADRLAEEGWLSVAEVMRLSLAHPEHGYYMTREPFGAAGDFITAPEISQMFGELLGLALVAAWQEAGAPAPFTLLELGPGRGTLMDDALRAARLAPSFLAGMTLCLFEASPRLRAIQAERLKAHAPRFPATLACALESGEGPLFVLANEFLDALPIRQFVRRGSAWQERVVVRTPEGLAFAAGPPAEAELAARLEARHGAAPEGALAEETEEAEAVVTALARAINLRGGLALLIDYGPAGEGLGDTLQAVRAHAQADILAGLGQADLTAHVRFSRLAAAARAAGAVVHGPLAQGILLERLGLGLRAERLMAGRDEASRAAIAAARHRLCAPEAMGALFKVLALGPEGGAVPPGFAAAP